MGRMAVVAILSLWIIPISIAVNMIVPEPYMDEIFHIPQAQHYCHGDFKTWDPMITTPPGLYYISLAFITALFPGSWFAKVINAFPELCSTSVLRSTNAVMALACGVLIYDLLICLRPSLSEKKVTTYAVLISLYPLHCFFTFLYYTDIVSLTAVLAMYLTSLKRRFFLSAMCGGFAILCRQTNVVWMAFVAASGAISYVEDLCRKYPVNFIGHKSKFEKQDVLFEQYSSVVAPTLRRRISDSTKSNHLINSRDIFLVQLNDSGLMEFVDLCLKFFCFKWNVLVTFFPYLLVLVAFGAFVFHNGGIVLGAKEAHVVSPHFAQLMYFGLAAAAASAPVHFTLERASTLWQSLRRNMTSSFIILLLTLVICFVVVHFFSVSHPYLLADNRHYTFYFWRKVIQAHWSMKYLLIPIYIYSWLSIISALGKVQKKVWVFLFCLATAAVLIPAPLIEFRYYTIPFYFYILNCQIEDSIKWTAIGIIYSSVNIAALLMFLYRPFRWDHEPGIQRFIW